MLVRSTGAFAAMAVVLASAQTTTDGTTVTTVIPFGFLLLLGVLVAVGLSCAALLTFAVVVVHWSEVPAAGGGATTPARSWRADRALTGIRAAVLTTAAAVTAATGVGVTTGLLTTPSTGLSWALTAAIIAAPLGALAAIFLGDHHAWLAHQITTTLLARRGVLPRRLMPFLDDAHRLGLLRAVGPVYQFRHAELQHHLATRYTSPPPDTGP